MKETVLFIINPISGTGKQANFSQLLQDELKAVDYTYDLVYTEHGGHATTLSKEAIGKYNKVVAVGGDGTVNEVAKGLINSNVAMGIIPVGSGNGLARHLKIPLNLKEAITFFNKGEERLIDTGQINGHPFVNVSGIGFDAHVAHEFSKVSKRGPIPYIKITAQEFQKYKSATYTINIDGKTYEQKAFLISFANSSQFGNNAYIAPQATVCDGKLDFCIMSDFPIVEAGQLAIKLFNKRLDKARFMKSIQGEQLIIEPDAPIKAHIDGEPILLEGKIEVKVLPNSLKMVYNEAMAKANIFDASVQRIKALTEEALHQIKSIE